ncbi:MAG: DUF86 domain-containing protein [Defluviitaleaceae bacterium]|nr:DUF86 domain-containing protein [Defluviitaleaceae bacterium]
MKEADLERIQKIRMHCINIQKTIENITLDQFKSIDGVDARDVCAFRLFQIGEHSHKLSDEIKSKYPDFAWGAAYRFRNVLGHDYDGVSFNAIWKSCKNDIPLLLEYVDKIISENN